MVEPVARGRRWVRVLVVLGVLVAVVAGVAWYQYPANRIRRALDRVGVPAGLRLTDEDVQDNGWICFDSCSYGGRYYVRSIPAREAADALAAELRAEGYEVDAVTRCERDCTYENNRPYLIDTYEYTVLFRGHDMYGSVTVGTRVDGQGGAELSLGP